MQHGFLSPGMRVFDDGRARLAVNLVQKIGPRARRRFHDAFDAGPIEFFDAAALELPRKLPSGPPRLGKDHHSRHGPIQSMRNAQIDRRRIALPGQVALDADFQTFDARRGLGGNARGLGSRQHGIVFEQDVKTQVRHRARARYTFPAAGTTNGARYSRVSSASAAEFSTNDSLIASTFSFTP